MTILILFLEKKIYFTQHNLQVSDFPILSCFENTEFLKSLYES
jgi:hypothetical protein